jgi:mono/diheme cytochrome c family protein
MRLVWMVVIVSCSLIGVSTSVEAQRRGGDPKLAAVKNPVPATPAAVKVGQRLYEKNCRQCHGIRGKGDGTLAPKNPSPANFTDDKWDHGASDGEIFAVIMNGAPAPNSEMKPMKGTLSPTEIWQVINYIRTFGPPRPPAKK